jgi:uncharacterized protein (TIGR02453 family)
LRALKENNEREWFTENKATFVEECDAPLRELVGEVGARLAACGIDLAPIARNPVFRIYRDVRFSKDKSPYKTNVGSALYREGDKQKPGLLYIHVEPAASFVAAGIYQPEPDQLRIIRQAIVDDPKGVARVVQALEKHGLALGMGDPMTRMPKGFEDQAGSPFSELIRYRSFVVRRPLFATEALPLLKFFWAKV